MSKLDALVNKIADKLIPEVRKVVREELEYIAEKGGTISRKKQPIKGDKNPKENGGGDYSAVIDDFKAKMGHGTGNQSLKMENAMIDGSDGSDLIVDESGNQISTSQLASSNPKVKDTLERISNNDYSKLLD